MKKIIIDAGIVDDLAINAYTSSFEGKVQEAIREHLIMDMKQNCCTKRNSNIPASVVKAGQIRGFDTHRIVII